MNPLEGIGLPGVSTIGETPVPRIAPFTLQFALLVSRSWKNSLREPLAVRARLGSTIIFALVLGLFFFGITNSQSSIQDREGVLFVTVMFSLFGNLTPAVAIFSKERPIVLRERSAGMYHGERRRRAWPVRLSPCPCFL